MEARADCQAGGGDLATLTQGQNETLKGVIVALPHVTELLIGLRRINKNSDVFKWLGGASPSYDDWQSGFPTPAQSSRLSVTLAATGWRDVNPNEPEIHYVCELPDACGPHCTSGSCGDGVIDAGELCDEGAANGAGDGHCATDGSRLQTCGDGILDATWSAEPEVCDEDELNGAAGYCNPTCDGYTGCGDGVVEGLEICDEGASNGTHGCSGIGLTVDGIKYCAGPEVTAWDQIDDACAATDGGGIWGEVDATLSATLGPALASGGLSEVALALRRKGGGPIDPLPCCDNIFVWPDGGEIGPDDNAWADGEPHIKNYGIFGCNDPPGRGLRPADRGRDVGQRRLVRDPAPAVPAERRMQRHLSGDRVGRGDGAFDGRWSVTKATWRAAASSSSNAGSTSPTRLRGLIGPHRLGAPRGSRWPSRPSSSATPPGRRRRAGHSTPLA